MGLRCIGRCVCAVSGNVCALHWAMCVRCVAVCVVCCCCMSCICACVCGDTFLLLRCLLLHFHGAACIFSAVSSAGGGCGDSSRNPTRWHTGSLDRVAPSLQRSRVHHLLLEVMISLVVPVNSQRAHTQPCSHRTALLRQAQTTTGTAATKRDGMQGYNLLRQGCTISSVADGRRCDRSRTPMFTSHCLAATGQ